MNRVFVTVLYLFMVAIASAQDRGGTGGGTGAGNGGNSGDGFLQLQMRKKISGALKHSENLKLITETEREKILAAIEKGIPILTVIPSQMEKDRFLNPEMDTFAPVSQPKEGEPTRLLDVKGNVVDARIVRDIKAQKRFTIQWDENRLRATTKEFTKIGHESLRDLLHEVLRYAFFMRYLSVNDDDRALSGKFYLPDELESLSLPSVGYRMDIKRRAKEIYDLEKEIRILLETDLKDHSMTKEVLKSNSHNMSLLMEIHSNPNIQITDPIEDVAEEFDRLELNLIRSRVRLLMQINWGYRPIRETSPKDRTDFAGRAAYLHQVAARIVETITWRKKLRESSWGKEWLQRYAYEVGPLFRDYQRSDWPKSDEQTKAKFDEYESELVGRLKALYKAYPPME